MKINRDEAKKMIEDAGLIYSHEFLGSLSRRLFRGVNVQFNCQGGVTTYGYVSADIHEMLDGEQLKVIIEAAKNDSFVMFHHFNKE